MLLVRHRLVAVLVAVGAVAVGALAFGAGPRPANDERLAPAGDSSVEAKARSRSELAVIRAAGKPDDRLNRVLKPVVEAAVLLTLVCLLAVHWCSRSLYQLRQRDIVALCAAPRGPPARPV
ncbi:MAG: hypothetical protein ACRDZV_10930 [Acidimicrobiia bacterium]